MVVAADEQLDALFALAFGACLAPGAAAGGLKFAHRHALEIAGFGEQHHRALIGDQVDVLKAALKIEDFGTPWRVIAGPQGLELVLDDAQHPFAPAENIFVVGNLGDQIFVL